MIFIIYRVQRAELPLKTVLFCKVQSGIMRLAQKLIAVFIVIVFFGGIAVFLAIESSSVVKESQSKTSNAIVISRTEPSEEAERAAFRRCRGRCPARPDRADVPP